MCYAAVSAIGRSSHSCALQSKMARVCLDLGFPCHAVLAELSASVPEGVFEVMSQPQVDVSKDGFAQAVKEKTSCVNHSKLMASACILLLRMLSQPPEQPSGHHALTVIQCTYPIAPVWDELELKVPRFFPLGPPHFSHR